MGFVESLEGIYILSIDEIRLRIAIHNRVGYVHENFKYDIQSGLGDSTMHTIQQDFKVQVALIMLTIDISEW